MGLLLLLQTFPTTTVPKSRGGLVRVVVAGRSRSSTIIHTQSLKSQVVTNEITNGRLETQSKQIDIY